MAQIFHSDSESDFWSDLEGKVKEEKKEIERKDHEKLEEPSVEAKAQEFMETVPVIFYRDQMASILASMRIASDMQLEARLISSTKALNKQHEAELKALKALHSTEVKSLKDEFVSLEKVLKAKDSRISMLERQLIDQEQRTSYLRIDKGNKYSEEEKIKELKEEMKYNRMGFDIQIAHMKELVAIYQKETDKANAELELLKTKIIENLQEFESKKSELDQEVKDVKDLAEIRVKVIQDKYEKFKEDVDKELNIRFVINKRQNEFIELLKKELKLAKTVIETPRLNEKYLKRLGRRGFSLSGAIEEERIMQGVSKGVKSKVMNKKHSIISSSFSTSASPIYSNASELELNYSSRFIGDSKLH